MTMASRSPLSVGSPAIQSTSASAASTRVWLQLPWPSPVSGSPSQAEPFDLRWLTITVSLPAGRGRLEGLGERRAIAGVDEARVDALVEDRVVTDRGGRGGLVDERDLDRVRPDGARVDEVVRTVAEDLVEPIDEVADRRVVVVLDLHEPDDVGVEADERAQDLGPLAIELERGVRAAALQASDRTADVRAIAAAGVESSVVK